MSYKCYRISLHIRKIKPTTRVVQSHSHLNPWLEKPMMLFVIMFLELQRRLKDLRYKIQILENRQKPKERNLIGESGGKSNGESNGECILFIKLLLCTKLLTW